MANFCFGVIPRWPMFGSTYGDLTKQWRASLMLRGDSASDVSIEEMDP